MRKRLWDLAKSRIEIGTILPGHRHKVNAVSGTCWLLYGDAPPGHMLQPRVDVLVVCGSHKTTLVGAGRLSVGDTPVQMLHG